MLFPSNRLVTTRGLTPQRIQTEKGWLHKILWVPDVLPRSTKKDSYEDLASTRVVLVVFTGRDRLRILLRYISRDLRSAGGVVDQVIRWSLHCGRWPQRTCPTSKNSSKARRVPPSRFGTSQKSVGVHQARSVSQVRAAWLALFMCRWMMMLFTLPNMLLQTWSGRDCGNAVCWFLPTW